MILIGRFSFGRFMLSPQVALASAPKLAVRFVFGPMFSAVHKELRRTLELATLSRRVGRARIALTKMGLRRVRRHLKNDGSKNPPRRWREG